LQICRAMFSEDQASFEGEHYRIDAARNFPKPLQSGGPPIMIGGGGEKRTLRLVAQYGDMCNFTSTVPDVVRHKLDVLEKHCGEVGRDPGEITKTVLATVVTGATPEVAQERVERILAAFGMTEEQASEFAILGTPEQVTEKVAALAAVGLDGIIVNLGREDAADLEAVAATGAALREAFA